MKKTVLSILAGAALTLSMASCGEKLLTDEQVQAEIQKGFDAGKAAVETEMDAKCEADFETKVTSEVERLKAEAAAAAALPADAK
jgi:predicted small lipoprotein YifL